MVDKNTIQDAMRTAGAWIKAAAADLAGLPISFRYGGMSFSEFARPWDFEVESERVSDDVTLHRATSTEPETGLQCIFEMKEFSDFPAAEWVVRFKNTGTNDTLIIEDVQALDASWTVPAESRAAVHGSLGSNCKIDDFQYTVDYLSSSAKLRMAPEDGRSSSGRLPFFNLEMPDGGVVIAIGWTGQWAAEFARGAGERLSVRAGMEKIHLRLRPGEEIRTPSILLMFWHGEPITGNNLLRRFIVKYHTPTVLGEPMLAPLCASTWGGMKSYSHLEKIAAMKEQDLGYDYYWIDAGWYGPEDSYSPDEFEGDWWKHVGDWTVNPAAHPNGLRPLSDAAHDAGMKFLLWIEPERAVSGTPLTRERPEWFLGENKEAGTLLFNLGIPEAREWLTDFVSKMIEDYGIDCYRQDFNMPPLEYWRRNDALDRQGMTEIRHIEGLYAFWDALRARHPHLLIDNCASGGRRIDLETIGRSIPLWRSDYQCPQDFHATGGQIHTFGLSHWVPLSATGTQMKPGDTYNFRSAMSAGIVFGIFTYERDPIDPNYPWDWHRKMIADYKRARPFYYGDFYPLAGCGGVTDSWLAYQMHRPDLDEGMLLAFRREDCPSRPAVPTALEIKLRGIDEDAVYEFEDADTGETRRSDGRLSVTISIDDPRESRLVFYRRI